MGGLILTNKFRLKQKFLNLYNLLHGSQHVEVVIITVSENTKMMKNTILHWFIVLFKVMHFQILLIFIHTLIFVGKKGNLKSIFCTFRVLVKYRKRIERERERERGDKISKSVSEGGWMRGRQSSVGRFQSSDPPPPLASLRGRGEGRGELLYNLPPSCLIPLSHVVRFKMDHALSSGLNMTHSVSFHCLKDLKWTSLFLQG